MGVAAMTQSRLINHLWTLLAVTFGLICLTAFLWVLFVS